MGASQLRCTSWGLELHPETNKTTQQTNIKLLKHQRPLLFSQSIGMFENHTVVNEKAARIIAEISLHEKMVAENAQ